MKEKPDTELIRHKKFIRDERKKDKLVKKQNKEPRPKSRPGVLE
jgi:hypothetical protein